MSDRVDIGEAWYENVADGVRLLVLNRPQAANGLTPDLIRDLHDALGMFEADHDIRCVVITGAGNQFCAGADLRAVRAYLDNDLQRDHEGFNVRVLGPLTQKLVNSRLPIVAAVNGAATAGGLDFALACDIRIASTTAKFGETYIGIGAMPANGGTYFLPRLLGSGMAAELVLTGDLIDAQRALEIGLVTRVAPPEDLLASAVELAARIAKRPWRALEVSKQALRMSWQLDLAATINSASWATGLLSHTAEFEEGVNAFLEKRTPNFYDIGTRHAKSEGPNRTE